MGHYYEPPAVQPVSNCGEPNSIRLAEISTVNPNGTVDLKPLRGRGGKQGVPVPAWYVPAIGDRVLLAELDGNPLEPIVVGPLCPQDGGLTAPGHRFPVTDSDLAAIAALSTTAYGRALLTLNDAAAARAALGLGTRFHLTKSADQTFTSTGNVRITFNGVLWDTANGFSDSNDWWVAPVSGVYDLAGGVHLSSMANTPTYLRLEVTPAAGGGAALHVIDNRQESNPATIAPFLSGRKDLQLAAGDKVALLVQMNSTNGNAAAANGSENTYLQGKLIP